MYRYSASLTTDSAGLLQLMAARYLLASITRVRLRRTLLAVQTGQVAEDAATRFEPLRYDLQFSSIGQLPYMLGPNAPAYTAVIVWR